jgi:Lrp/AsnC family leucine-responsive transcriptional regulator
MDVGDATAPTMERFLREKLYRIQGIRHTRSTFSLRTLKLVMSADPLPVGASD